MPLNFSDALSSLKKKSQLQGVPLSQQEVSGVAAGYSEQASSRLAKIKALELEKQKHEETLAFQKDTFTKRMAQEREDRHEAESRSKKGALGVAAGTIIGTLINPGYGTAIGAAIGGLAENCIIISACTSKNSYETNIAREFRNKYMSGYQLGGYYAIAHRIAPIMEKSHLLKLFLKKFLVNRLIDYGEYILGYKPKIRLRTSEMITGGFLSLCGYVGMQINIKPYIRTHV